jgi:hypothetical protein
VQLLQDGTEVRGTAGSERTTCEAFGELSTIGGIQTEMGYCLQKTAAILDANVAAVAGNETVCHR